MQFHHEFSSLLLRAYGFDIHAWVSLNPQQVEYATSNSQVVAGISNSASVTSEEKWYALGLIAEYGLTTPEDDFNLYAELAFTNPDEMMRLTGL